VGIVEVNAEGEHALENAYRGLNGILIAFYGPGAKARQVEFLIDRNHEVLVPSDEPVGARRLIEVDGFDDEIVGPEDLGDERLQLWREDQRLSGRNLP